jgi:hypothetical protein
MKYLTVIKTILFLQFGLQAQIFSINSNNSYEITNYYIENQIEEITNGKQKLTSRQETMEVDWGVR